MINTNFQNINSTYSNQVFKDYTTKISIKLYESNNIQEECSDINSLIVLLNYCFNEKNNFFVENFNKKLIQSIRDSYNKIKSNIFSEKRLIGIESIFHPVEKNNIKTLKFILLNYIKVYDSIVESEATNNADKNNLWKKVPKRAMENCLVYMENYTKNF